MRYRYALVILSVFFILAITGAYAQTISSCGNDKCEKVEFTLKEGESKSINVNGMAHTFRLAKLDLNGKSLLSIDGSDPMDDASYEMNVYMDGFQQKYGFKISASTVHYDDEKAAYVIYRIEETDWCQYDCIGEGVYALDVYPGWNLIHTAAAYVICNPNQPQALCEGDVVVSYMYVNPLNRYVRLSPDQEQFSESENAILSKYADVDQYFENGARWFYVKGKEKKTLFLNFGNGWGWDDPTAMNNVQLKLFKGWNLLSVLPLMTGRKIVDFGGNCEVLKAFGFNPVSQSWEDISDTELSSSDVVGAGFAIKVAEDCKLGIKEETIPTIPQLPN